MKKQGRLRALRKISELGKITYKVLGFQGDNTVKNEVIARYLEAEQKGGQEGKYEINKENYKFKYKGEHTLSTGKIIYIFFLTPRHKEVGLFKGELWLDAQSYLPVMGEGNNCEESEHLFQARRIRPRLQNRRRHRRSAAYGQHHYDSYCGQGEPEYRLLKFFAGSYGAGKRDVSGAANSFALIAK